MIMHSGAVIFPESGIGAGMPLHESGTHLQLLAVAAREIKSGPLKLTPFIERQILKDIELINAYSMKVEWHLLAGGDSKAIAALKKAGIDVIVY